ncbi:MAG: VacJ family lipoprotein [Sterolibacterium sp.]|nr:VacJ family lipoprotein [Sterolibacterium sp.]
MDEHFVNKWQVGHRYRKAMLALFLAAGVLSGCATSGNPRDPIEGFNRAMFDINEGLDKTIVRPIAQGYETVLPSPVRKGVTNFFANIGDLFIAINNLLQGKVPEALSDVSRLAVNTTFGLLGVIDVASDLGLEKHEEDFGQTFGRWGVESGPYLVLPLLGPSTLRDSFGLAADTSADPVVWLDHVPTRNSLLATRAINNRAGLLAADKIIEEAALDRYSYMRDAYLQRRRSLIYDGNPPRETEDSADYLSFAPAPGNGVTTIRLEPVIGASNLVVERESVDISTPSVIAPTSWITEPLRPTLVNMAWAPEGSRLLLLADRSAH